MERNERLVFNCTASDKNLLEGGIWPFDMPKTTDPNKSVFEELGFKFTEDDNKKPDSILCLTLLPVGWSLRKTTDPTTCEILDENKRVRGITTYDVTNNTGYTKLNRRYQIHTTDAVTKSGEKVRKVYFGSREEVIFSSGSLLLGYYSQDVEDSTVESFTKSAREYADEYYPDWCDVTAYWGDDLTLPPEKHTQLPKGRGKRLPRKLHFCCERNSDAG